MSQRDDPKTDYLVPAEKRGASRNLAKVERNREIIQLRREHLTLDAIVDHLAAKDPPVSIHRDTVGRIVQAYLEGLHREDSETVEQLRALENERLDYLAQAWQDRAKTDPKAANVMLRIHERRAKLNSLDAARKIEIQGSVQHLHALGVDPEEVKRMEEAFRTAEFDTTITDAEVVDEAEALLEAGP